MTANSARPAGASAASETLAADAPTTLSEGAKTQIRLLHAYFGFQGYVGAVCVVLAPFARFLKPLVTVNGNPWVVIPLLAVNTWAAFRARRLLREREPEGAWMAGGTFGWNLIVAASAGHFGLGALMSGIGVLVAVNLHRELRSAE